MILGTWDNTICKPRRHLMGLIWLYALLTIVMCFRYRLEGVIGGLTNLNVQVFQNSHCTNAVLMTVGRICFVLLWYRVCACMVASVSILYASVQWCPPEAIGRCNAAVTKVIFLASGSPLMARTTMKIITKWQLIVDTIFNIQLFSHFNFSVTAMAMAMKIISVGFNLCGHKTLPWFGPANLVQYNTDTLNFYTF